MDLLDLIKQRKSTRAFTDKDVGEAEMNKLFEAARWAASSYNGQPWRFIYANKNTNPELYEKLFNLLVKFNQAWVKSAPVLMLTMARVKYEKSGEPYNHAWHDLGLALGNMYILATSQGISLHEMAGFSAEKAKSELNIPDKLEPVTMVAIGYQGDPANLPLDIYKMETATRERKPIEEIAFNKIFNGVEDKNK